MKRPVRIEGDIAYVPLTNGYTATISASDVSLVAGRNWSALTDGSRVYAVSNDPMGGGKYRLIRMHRVIMGDPDGLQVDHWDGDGLNNQRTNLRIATNSQNQHNQRTRRDNTSGYKGVTFRKDKGRWHAKIMLNGQRQHLGLFNCPTAAHFAYIKASRALHGEFGRIA